MQNMHHMKRCPQPHIQTQKRQSTKIKFTTSFSNSTIYDALSQRRGWEETHNDNPSEWDLQWADRDRVNETLDRKNAKTSRPQKLNHFRNARELCRKDLLVKNLKRQKRHKRRSQESENRDDFFPVTFDLPNEYSLFVEEFKKRGGLWIMKPVGSAQGRGIFLFSKLSDISNWKQQNRDLYPLSSGGKQNQIKGNHKKDDHTNDTVPESYIVQKYVQNPLLIGGKKFDLRLFVLVTNFSPLTIWLYRAGFARFSNTPYKDDVSQIANSLMHLTNISIQKKQGDYDERTGGKWDLRKLKLYLMSSFGPEVVDALFGELQKIVIQSLMSVEHVMMQDKRCFELYGYDVMIDDSLKPWLLEVNSSPSLSASTKDDYDLKYCMMNDVLDVVDVEEVLKGNEVHVGGFDLVYGNGVMLDMDPKDTGWSTYLGGYVDIQKVAE